MKIFLPPDTPVYLFQSTSLSKQVVKQSEWKKWKILRSSGVTSLSLPRSLAISRTAVSGKTVFHAAESSAKADQPRIMICLREQGRSCVLHSWLRRLCEAARQKYHSAVATLFMCLSNVGRPSPPLAASSPIELSPVRRREGAHLSFTSGDTSHSGRNVVYLQAARAYGKAHLLRMLTALGSVLW